MSRELITILLILIIMMYLYSINDYFDIIDTINTNINTNIDMYVISLRQTERLENIKKQQNKINKEIIISDAVKGDLLNVDELIKNNVLSDTFSKGTSYRKREIGCYLSHFNIYEKIKSNNNNNGYTIIFEDDFVIVVDNFLEKINNSINNINLNNIDFDILFLGNLNNNHGKLINDTLYFVDNETGFIGCHGYLINNKNIDKIIEYTKFIDRPIDTRFDDLSKENKLIVLMLYPTIVNQGGSCYSSITDMNIEHFA
jgi:glycosyl transferase family 25